MSLLGIREVVPVNSNKLFYNVDYMIPIHDHVKQTNIKTQNNAL
jgi:hypothetical protein